jgi:iron complex outermembrane receptor protein
MPTLCNRTLTPIAAALLAATAVSLPQLAAAQGRATALEEVIVTAQKREESLQDAPIAVSALTGDQLERRGITGLGDMMAGAIPALKVQPFPQNPGTLTISIRGIGPSDAGQITKEPGVGIYQDNVYLGRSQGLGLDMADLQRIEVLRGPQGTLYGRNVVGGAVNLISKKPAGEFGFKQTLSYGFDYDDFKSITHIDTDTYSGFSGKLSYLYSDHDGWVENTGSGSNFDDYNSFEKKGVRVALNWNNDDNLSVDYVYDWSDSDIMQNYFQLFDAGNLTSFNADQIDPPDFSDLGTFIANATSGAYLAALVPFPNNEPSGDQVDKTRADLAIRPNEVEVWGHALTVEWEINDSIALKSISAYRDLDQETHVNYGGVFGIGLANAAPYDQIDQDQWSQEFQLVGTAWDDSIEYVVGAYYYNENAQEVTPPTGAAMEVAFVPLSTDISQIFSTIAPFTVVRGGALSTLEESVYLSPLATYPDRDVETETDSWAVYGQARWQATEQLGLTLGLRYTNDEKDSTRFFSDSLEVNQISNIDDSSTDPMVTLDYDWSDEVNTYLRYATGYKAGGVNLRSTTFVEYDSEEVESLEFGLKSTFWDQRARINTAIWMSTYSDYQIDFSDPADITVSETFNADNGDVDLWGIELEVSLVPIDGLTINLDYNYLDWELDPQGNPLNNGAPEVFDIPQAPKHSGTASVDYEFEPFSFGTLILHADYIGQSSEDMRFSPKDNRRRDGRDIFNARIILDEINIGNDNGYLRAALWGKNIFDEEYVSYSITNTGVNSISDAWGEPQSIGIELVYEY